MMRKTLLAAATFFGLVLLAPSDGYSQVKTPAIDVSFFSALSYQDWQPFWLSANRQGMINEFEQSNTILRMSGFSEINKETLFDYAYGVEVLARGFGATSSVYFHQAYITGKFSVFQLNLGRKQQTWGEHFGELSTGSLVLGRNATPIPLINLSIPEFVPVPFTYEFIQFKGNLAHGWLENSRYVTDAYLHQKTFYLQGGFDHWPIQGYAGMIHVVQWGGISPRYGKLPSNFKDYTKIFFGKSADEDDQSAPGGEINNALGNHLGIWDFGLKGGGKDFNFHVYWQHFFEDYTGLMFRNIGDGLFGIGVATERKKIISGVLLEYVRTKNQTGPGLHGRPGDFDFCEQENCGYKYGGRDNYYNNGLYRSGWSYYGNILGNPLLKTVRQIETYLPDVPIYENMVESNRIVAHHIGLKGYINESIKYRAFITQTLHFGSYQGINFGERFGSMDPKNNLEEYAFYPSLKQWNFMIESIYRFSSLPAVEFNTTLALDHGDLTNNFGIMLGVNWELPVFD